MELEAGIKSVRDVVRVFTPRLPGCWLGDHAKSFFYFKCPAKDHMSNDKTSCEIDPNDVNCLYLNLAAV
jgi:hypothetical protein